MTFPARLLTATLLCLAALTAFTLAHAADNATNATKATNATPDIAGTWECRLPKSARTPTPPIAWFGEVQKDDNGGTVEVDAFSRTLVGLARIEMASAQAATLTLPPTKGGSIKIRMLTPDSDMKQVMELHTAKGSLYRCYRLPRFDDNALPIRVEQGTLPTETISMPKPVTPVQAENPDTAPSATPAQ